MLNVSYKWSKSNSFGLLTYIIMKQYLFFFLLLLASFSSYAQTDQVITLKGDTLTGKVSFSDGKSYVQTITIKKEKGKSHFKVYEVKSLNIDEELYKTIKVYGKYQLGLVIKEGSLSLYKILDVEVSTSNEYATSVLIKLDGSLLIVPNIGFKKYMATFLKDCDSVVNGLENKEYKKADVEKIVDDYNNCIELNAAKAKNVAPKVNLQPQKVKQVEALIMAVEKESDIPDKKNVLEMLQDVKSKLNDGAKIPTYLKGALQESLKDYDLLLTQLSQILS